MLPVDTSLWEKYSDLDRLVRTTAWCRRFLHNSLKKGDIREARLTSAELEDALNLLLHLSQQLSYAQELNQLQKGQPVANSSSLLLLCPLLGEEGLIRVGGRLENAELTFEAAHPDKRSRITRLLVDQVHSLSKHAGPNTMLSILSEHYHIVGVKSMLRAQCVACQRAYANS